MRHVPVAALTVLGCLLVPGLPSPARAQNPPSVAGLPPWDSPLDGTARRAARLLQRTTAADPRRSPRDFTTAALAAAEQEVEVRRELEWSGQGLWVDVTKDASRRIRDAELALAAGPADRLAAHERYWAMTAELERVIRIRVGRAEKSFPGYELDLARAGRLLAEKLWYQARHEADPGRGPATPAAATSVEDPLDAGRLARLLADARHRTPPRRREAVATALTDAVRMMWELERSGCAPVWDVLPAGYLEWRLEMARDRETSAGERLHHLELTHLVAWSLETIARIRVSDGQKGYTKDDLHQSRAARLHRSLAIQEASQAGDWVRFPVGVLNDPFFPPGMDPVEQRRYSRVRTEVMRPGFADLVAARREALLASYEVRLELERCGQAFSVDVMAQLLEDLCDAEMAAAATPAGSVPALASYLARLDDLDRVALIRVEFGQKNFSSAELFAVRAQRLNAQRRLAEAWAATHK